MLYLKKTIPFIFLAFVFSALILSSCSDVDNQIDPNQSVYSINELEKDDRFVQFLAIQHEITSNISDLNKANLLLAKGELNQAEQRTLAASFGYNDYQSFSQAMLAQQELIQDLEQDYRLSSVSTAILEEKIEFMYNDETLRKTIIGGNVSTYSIAGPIAAPAPAPVPADWCRTLCHIEVGACLTAAAAAATAALLACPGTGPAAVACAAAVLTAQAAAEALCLVNYSRCLEDCINR